MRLLGCLFLLLMLARPACAQERLAFVELEDGRAFSGLVIHLDSNTIALQVNGKLQAFRTAQVRHCRFERAPGADPEGVAVVAQDREPPAVVFNRSPTPQASGTPVFLRRMQSIERCYPWLEPTNEAQWASLGISFFALLSFAIHLSSRICASERSGFGRAAGLSLWVIATVAGQAALLPDSLPVLAIAGIVNAVILVQLVRKFYALPAFTALLCFGLMCLQGGGLLMALRVLDVALRAVGGVQG